MNFDQLIQTWLNDFYQKGEEVIKNISTLTVPTEIMCMKYATIEPIPDEQKEELRQYAKDMFPDKKDEEIEKVIKVVYTMGCLL